MRKFLFIFFFIFFNYANAELANELVIEGNKRISAETIKVYGDIKLKSDYSSNDIDEILEKLYSTNFFQNVSISLNNGILKITVKEYDIINSILIEGEKSTKVKDGILKRLSLKEKGSFIKNLLKQDVDIIKRLYASIGYNFAKVEAKIENFSENRINVVFLIDRGDKTKISEIRFIGDKKVKDRRLRDIIVSEEHRFWKVLSKNTNLNNENIQLDKRLLVNYYKSIGYYDVQVLSSNAEIDELNRTSLTFNIDAGTRYKIKKISTNVDPVLDKELFIPLNKEFKKIIGKYYSPFIVKDLLEELDLLINNNDLQFIEHSVNEIVDDKNIEIKINIFEGAKQTVERINIKGNTITNESVIRSELELDEGDPFNNLKLDQSIANLKARNLFGDVRKKIESGSSTDLKVVDITVEEKPTGEISAGAGIGTSGGSFAFNIKENNWLGRGIQVSSFVDVSEETFKGQIQIRDKNFNHTNNDLSYHISSVTNDKPDSGYENSIISSGIGTRFEQYKDIYLAPSIVATHDDLTVQSSASSNLKKQAGSFTDVALDYSLQSDKRNRRFMPTDGYISTFAQAVPLYADSAYLKNVYSFSTYNSFTEDFVGAFKFYASTINGWSDEDVRLSKRLIIPSSRLRGFESGRVGPKDGEDYIGGNYATAINLETNLPNLLPDSSRTEVSLFLDVGNVWGVDYDSSIDESNKLRSSVGSAINWTSPIGPVSFVISQNLSKANTDKTESFNFRLGTTF
tara:strand:+ start:63 stop:2288 length:2226 start_codon:yes stop_codon:yes gene_type:complete